MACTGVPRGYPEAAIIKDEERAVPNHYLLRKDWALMDNLVMCLVVPLFGINGTHISNTLMGMKPTSRGTVTIASKDPIEAPLIDPNYFSTEVDKYVWRHLLRRITAFMIGDTALGRLVEGETPLPGFEPVSTEASDEYLDNRIRAQGM